MKRRVEYFERFPSDVKQVTSRLRHSHAIEVNQTELIRSKIRLHLGWRGRSDEDNDRRADDWHIRSAR